MSTGQPLVMTVAIKPIPPSPRNSKA
ncbi:MAG: hypothetical protein ACLSAH_01900 [Bilophila wadsworthia]